ncbi:MAG: YrzE family protein [Caulobacter sp.]|nr:YrzE family protein [Caulobacter sp.]
MSINQPTAHEPHPLHTLISWPAVIAGAVVAIAVGAMLNLLGVALGAASINPYDLTRGEAEAFSAGAGAWVAIANALALFAGGFVASRVAKYTDHHKGYLHGLAVWAVAFIIALFLAGSSAVGGVNSMIAGLSDNGREETYIADQAVGPLDGERSDAAAAVPPAAQPEAEAAADSTATVALWAFIAMLLGLFAAAFGGRYGSRKHAWETKAHVTETPATVVGSDPHLHTTPHTAPHSTTPTI